jgi:hypothetical protein
MLHSRRAQRTTLRRTEDILFLEGVYEGQKPPTSRVRTAGAYISEKVLSMLCKDDSNVIGGVSVKPDMHRGVGYKACRQWPCCFLSVWLGPEN